MSLQEKINAVVQKIYRGTRAVFTPAAEKQIARLTELGFSDLPVCIAKTQYSFSDDAAKRGAPSDFEITVREVKVAAGAGFVVVYTGSILTMPGLSKKPAALNIRLENDGTVSGIF